MATELSLESPVDCFFIRCGLTAQDKARCFELATMLRPGEPVAPALGQGYCSLTLFLGETHVLQFRPHAYHLDIRIVSAARDLWHSLIPDTILVGEIHSTSASSPDLLVYEMERVHSSSLADVQNTQIPTTLTTDFYSRLLTDFAAFLSQSWYHGRMEHLPLGLVGRSLITRLKSLLSDLPRRFQGRARHILKNLHLVKGLPWVLTHGDIRTSNLMVDVSTGALRGVIDWAEAERLPFGICLYGLEEMLGSMTSSGFQYRQDADILRNVFWSELMTRIPELKKDPNLQAVLLARDLGVLLWFGIAFDDGALDRVVQESGRDVEEIHKLDAYLGTDAGPAATRSEKMDTTAKCFCFETALCPLTDST